MALTFAGILEGCSPRSTDNSSQTEPLGDDQRVAVKLALEPPEPLSAAALQEIRTEMTGPFEGGGPFFSEDTAERFSKQFGRAAIPVLIGFLEEDISFRAKGKIAFYLGKFRNEGFGIHPAVLPIMNLIDRSSAIPIGEHREFMLVFSMYGLGYTKDDVAFAFLKKLATDDYWRRFSLVPFGVPAASFSTHAKFLRKLRQGAINGIGDAGNPKALDVLDELRKGEARDLRKYIDQVKKVCKERISGRPYRGNEVP
jgi:hypothetical protein